MTNNYLTKFEDREDVKKLIPPDSVLKKLDLSGWIVLKNLLKKDDLIVIGKNQLFDRPVLATVNAISNVNTVGIILHTEDAKDCYGNTWKSGFREGWFDIMWDIYKVEKL